jgi:hypothetical protein
MTLDRGSDPKSPRDEVLSKVDALLRKHRSGGLDLALDASPEPEIPTLTELIEGPPRPAPDVALAEAAEPAAGEAVQPDAPAPVSEVQSPSGDEAWLVMLRPEIERVVAEMIAARLPQAIQQQVMPEVMLQLGDGLNRLRDAMRTTVEAVVRETIEREVKRALKALLKERDR